VISQTHVVSHYSRSFATSVEKPSKNWKFGRKDAMIILNILGLFMIVSFSHQIYSLSNKIHELEEVVTELLDEKDQIQGALTDASFVKVLSFCFIISSYRHHFIRIWIPMWQI